MKKTQIVESLLQPKHEFLAFFVCRDPLEKLMSVYKYLMDMRVGIGQTIILPKVIFSSKRKVQECLPGQVGRILPVQYLRPGHSSSTWWLLTRKITTLGYWRLIIIIVTHVIYTMMQSFI